MALAHICARASLATAALALAARVPMWPMAHRPRGWPAPLAPPPASRSAFAGHGAGVAFGTGWGAVQAPGAQASGQLGPKCDKPRRTANVMHMCKFVCAGPSFMFFSKSWLWITSNFSTLLGTCFSSQIMTLCPLTRPAPGHHKGRASTEYRLSI